MRSSTAPAPKYDKRQKLKFTTMFKLDCTYITQLKLQK